MSQYYLESILSELDKESNLVYMIKSLVGKNSLDDNLLKSIAELIKQEINKTQIQSRKSKLQKSLDYVEYLRQEEEKEKSSTDLDEELETQLYDL